MRYKRFLAGVAGFGIIVAGCGAASHIKALQPPSVNSSGKIRASRSDTVSSIRIAENSEYLRAANETLK